MSRELVWLAMTVAMTGLIWVPYMLDRFAVWGIMATLGNPPPSPPRQSEWAVRMMAAHKNAIENLALFAPLVLMLGIEQISTPTTVAACITFFAARLGHVVFYTMGIPVLRTLAFLVGFAAEVVLFFAVLGLI
jgi:uncharacterized MAPEG superfamily protein